MNNSDVIKTLLLSTINEIAADPSKYAVNPGRDFTRNRKLGFHNILLMLLIMEADCIKEELYRFFGRNPDDPDTFFEPNGKSTRGFNQVHINAFYSILDRRFTNLVIQPGRKRNEYAAFCEMVDAAGNDGSPTVYFADMGYASYNNFAHVIGNGQFFLIRCNDKRLRGIPGRPIEDLKEMDCRVGRILTRTQSKKKHSRPDLPERYRHICQTVPMIT